MLFQAVPQSQTRGHGFVRRSNMCTTPPIAIRNKTPLKMKSNTVCLSKQVRKCEFCLNMFRVYAGLHDMYIIRCSAIFAMYEIIYYKHPCSSNEAGVSTKLTCTLCLTTRVLRLTFLISGVRKQPWESSILPSG